MTHVISVINLKGGVGKTTMTVSMAEILAGEFDKRVLVIDLDPQTNSTMMLIGERAWETANREGRTLAPLFKDSLRPKGDPPTFDLDRTLYREASPIKRVRTLDLLPSSLDLIDVQDDLAAARGGRFHTDRPAAHAGQSLYSVSLARSAVKCANGAPPSWGLGCEFRRAPI